MSNFVCMEEKQIVSVIELGVNILCDKVIYATLKVYYWGSWCSMGSAAKLFNLSRKVVCLADLQPQSQAETGKCTAGHTVVWCI